MHTASPGKARPRIPKKTVFLLVLALMALAYAAIPLIALACGANNANGNGAAAGNGNGAASSDANANGNSNKDNAIIADLKAGNLVCTVNGKPAAISGLPNIAAGTPNVVATVQVNGQSVALQAVFNKKGVATLTLPDGKQVDLSLGPDGKPVVKVDSNKKANSPRRRNNTLNANPKNGTTNVLTSSDKQIIAQLRNSAKFGLQFFDAQGHLVKFNSLTKGERFQIKIGTNKPLIAQFLGKDTASVFLPSHKSVTIQFGPQPATV